MTRFLAIIWLIIIAVLHAVPGSELPTPTFFDFLQLDKFVHAFLFFVAILLIASQYTPQHFLRKERFILTCLVAYGFILECCQAYFFIERSMDILDWFADCLGVVFGVLIVRKFPRIQSYVFKKS